MANGPQESESERLRAKTATEKRKLASASRRKKQVLTQGGGDAFGDLSYLEKEESGRMCRLTVAST